MRRWLDTPRKRVVVLALSCWLVVLGALEVVAVPYVRMAPGPMFDVLGEADGVPVIQIEGAPVYPTNGRLDMTTVSERGGPFGNLTLFEAFTGWLDPAVAVVPTDLLYPPDTSADDAQRAGEDQFSDSLESARIAALRQVGEPVETRPWITQVVPGSPAEGQLRHGDVVLSVDGRPVERPEQVARLIGEAGPGTRVRIEVRRAEEVTSARVVTAANPHDSTKGYVGVSLGIIADSPVKVDIELDDVGGPSAGLVFALGIVDKLTPGELLADRLVAGTGTVDHEGRVGPIGGIAQKLAAAEQGGATLFLAPVANCDQALAHAPDGLQVAAIETLDEAVDVLEGRIAPPACPVG